MGDNHRVHQSKSPSNTAPQAVEPLDQDNPHSTIAMLRFDYETPFSLETDRPEIFQTVPTECRSSKDPGSSKWAGISLSSESNQDTLPTETDCPRSFRVHSSSAAPVDCVGEFGSFVRRDLFGCYCKIKTVNKTKK